MWRNVFHARENISFFLLRFILYCRSPDGDVDDCHVITNDKTIEFNLTTVVEEAGKYEQKIIRKVDET